MSSISWRLQRQFLAICWIEAGFATYQTRVWKWFLGTFNILIPAGQIECILVFQLVVFSCGRIISSLCLYCNQKIPFMFQTSVYKIWPFYANDIQDIVISMVWASPLCLCRWLRSARGQNKLNKLDSSCLLFFSLKHLVDKRIHTRFILTNELYVTGERRRCLSQEVD